MVHAIEVIFYQPEFQKEFEFLYNQFKEKEKLVLDLYYGFHDQTVHTAKKIAGQFHLTPTRINQIKQRALLRLKWRAEELNMERVLTYIDFKFNGEGNCYKTAKREVIYYRRVHKENQLYKTDMTLV